MTQEEKDLLLKDLCGRLPYKVKLHAKYINVDLKELDGTLKQIDDDKICGLISDTEDTYSYIYVSIDEIKPYLFPLSSMTEEQWMDTPYANLNKFTFDSFKCGCSTLAFETYEVNLNYVVEFINWCYKNHFDINGLIEKGLALKAPDGMYNQNI